MRTALKSAFEAEMEIAERLILSGQLDCAMQHLQIAHVLGQNHVMPHVRSHWSMLRIALKRRAFADGCGQTIRIILGAVGSAVGVVPVGNTGGSDVNMFARMPIPAHIAALIERDRVLRRNDNA